MKIIERWFDATKSTSRVIPITITFLRFYLLLGVVLPTTSVMLTTFEAQMFAAKTSVAHCILLLTRETAVRVVVSHTDLKTEHGTKLKSWTINAIFKPFESVCSDRSAWSTF